MGRRILKTPRLTGVEFETCLLQGLLHFVQAGRLRYKKSIEPDTLHAWGPIFLSCALGMSFPFPLIFSLEQEGEEMGGRKDKR
jgi:hypothetical protein